MAVHDKFANLAQRLIAKHGRAMVLRKLSRTPEDDTMPWRGTSTDPEEGYEYEQPVVGVVTDYNEDEIDGDQIHRGDKRLLVAAKPNAGIDLLKADSLLDEEQVYGIIRGNLLKPGVTEILYEFQVRQ